MQYGSTPKSQKERKKKDALRRKGSSRRRGGDSDRFSDRQRRSAHGGNAARRKRSTTGTKHPPRSTRHPRHALSVPRVLDTQDSKSRLNSKFELPPQRSIMQRNTKEKEFLEASSQQPSSDKEDIGQDRGGGRDQHRQSNPAPAQGPGQVIESDDHYVQFVPLANQQNPPAPAIQPTPAVAQTQDPNDDYGGSPAANPAPDPPAAGGNENYANLDVPVGNLPPPPPPSPPPPPPPPPQHRDQGSSRRKKKKQDRRRR